jgi:hypothetical protein
MTEPLWLDCPSATDCPTADRLEELATDERHVVLRFPADAFSPPRRLTKAALIGRLASALPECSVFDSGQSSGVERITVMKVIRPEVVRANEAEFVRALRLFRRTASELANRLAQRLGVAPDRLAECRQGRAQEGWFGRVRGLLGLTLPSNRLDREWSYDFHGLECRFENRKTGQVVEVRLEFGTEFGVLDPYFFALFLKSTPELSHLARLIRHDYHDSARVLNVLRDSGHLRLVEGPYRGGLVVRDEEPPKPTPGRLFPMGEADWNGCTDPDQMLALLRGSASERKLRLLAAACCRRAWHLLLDERVRRAVEVAERYADGAATREELAAAHEAAEVTTLELLSPRDSNAPPAGVDRVAVVNAADAATGTAAPGLRAEDSDSQWSRDGVRGVALAIREALGAEEGPVQAALLHDIFGPLPFRPVVVDRRWLEWDGGTVRKLAQAIYEGRRFGDLPVLADALLDAGCDDEALLAHCHSGQAHVPGCWVLDLILSKDR